MSTFAPPSGPPVRPVEAATPRLEAPQPLPQFDAPSAPPSPRRRGFALGVAVLALVVVGLGAVLAASGGRSADSGSELPPFSLAVAAERTADAGTVQFDMTVAAAGVGDVTIAGAVDNEQGVSRLTMDLGSLLGTSSEPMPGLDGAVDILVDTDAGVVYLGADELGGLLPVDASWISLDLAELADATGQSFDDLGGQFAVDPVDAAAALLDAESVAEIGPETIDGEATVHYQVTVDIAAALAAVPKPDLSMPQVGELDLPDTAVYDVWVTEDSQLRRMSFDIDVAGQSLSLVMNVFATDEPLDLELPSGDDVFDLTGLLTF